MTIRGELDKIEASMAWMGDETNPETNPFKLAVAFATVVAAGLIAIRIELDGAESPEVWVSDPEPECAVDYPDECGKVFVDVEPGQGSPACCCGRDMKPAGRWRLIPDTTPLNPLTGFAEHGEAGANG